MLFPKTFVAFYSDLLIPTVGDYRGFPGGSDGEESACNAGDWDSIPGSGRFPGEGNGYTHSTTLAWRSPWIEKPDKLQTMGSHRVRHV